jgi:hypothetical protein
MRHDPSRRELFAAGAFAGALLVRPSAAEGAAGEPPPARVVPAAFPTQPPELAQEFVGVCHGNLDRVRELLARWPTLSEAAWDWGFGDWETALGAASHTGRREIAELLLAHGARPTIFSAAMLGQLEVVKAFVAAAPGVQRTPGPHGIPLLAHAEAGGEPAAAVVRYLEELGDAGQRPPTVELATADAAAVVGTYAFGALPDERFTVEIGRRGPTIERLRTSARNLFHVGERAFFPAGAPQVRIRFSGETPLAAEVAIFDPDLVVTARRVAS